MYFPANVATRAQPNLAERIVLFVGWERRKALSGIDQGVEEDAMRRSTPGKIWALVMTDVSERMGDLILGAPSSLESEASNTPDLGGTHDRGKNMVGDETGQTWPAL